MSIVETVAGWFGLRPATKLAATEALVDPDERMFRALVASPEAGSNDLSDSSMALQRRHARQFYFRHAIGGALPDSIVARVLGAGAQWKANDPRVQEVVSRFVDDSDNNLAENLPRMATELLTFGELCLPIFITPANADVRLGYLLPDQIEDVVWRSGDAKKPIAILQRRTGLGEKDPRRLWVVPHQDPAWDGLYPPHAAIHAGRPQFAVRGEDGNLVELPNDGGEVLPEIRKLLQDDPDLVVAGYAFYHRTGSLVAGRGRGIYERIGTWLRAVDDFFFGILRNAILQGRYLIECVLTGADDAAVKAKRDQLAKTPPDTGAILVHNDQEEWRMLAPSVAPAAQIREVLTGVLKVIGLAVGLAGHEVGAEDDTNRSTAQESRSVSINRAKRFQRELMGACRAWVRYQVDQKVHRGQIPKGADLSVQVILPELDAADESELAKSVSDGVAAMATAIEAELVLSSDARAWVYSLMGLPVPSEEAFEKALDKERKAREEAELARMRALGVPPDFGGGGDAEKEPAGKAGPGGGPSGGPGRVGAGGGGGE